MSTLARQEDMLPTLWQDVELTRTGLRFKRDVSFEEWQDVGERLRFIESSVGFWIGDWINYGEAPLRREVCAGSRRDGAELPRPGRHGLDCQAGRLFFT